MFCLCYRVTSPMGETGTHPNKIWNTAFVFAFCCGVCGATWCKCRIPWGRRWLVGLSHRSGIEESYLTLASMIATLEARLQCRNDQVAPPSGGLGQFGPQMLLPRSLGSRASPVQYVVGYRRRLCAAHLCGEVVLWLTARRSVEPVVKRDVRANHRKV